MEGGSSQELEFLEKLFNILALQIFLTKKETSFGAGQSDGRWLGAHAAHRRASVIISVSFFKINERSLCLEKIFFRAQHVIQTSQFLIGCYLVTVSPYYQ